MASAKEIWRIGRSTRDSALDLAGLLVVNPLCFHLSCLPLPFSDCLLVIRFIHIKFCGVQSAPLQRVAPHSSCNTIDMFQECSILVRWSLCFICWFIDLVQCSALLVSGQRCVWQTDSLSVVSLGRRGSIISSLLQCVSLHLTFLLQGQTREAWHPLSSIIVQYSICLDFLWHWE